MRGEDRQETIVRLEAVIAQQQQAYVEPTLGVSTRLTPGTSNVAPLRSSLRIDEDRGIGTATSRHVESCGEDFTLNELDQGGMEVEDMLPHSPEIMLRVLVCSECAIIRVRLAQAQGINCLISPEARAHMMSCRRAVERPHRGWVLDAVLCAHDDTQMGRQRGRRTLLSAGLPRRVLLGMRQHSTRQVECEARFSFEVACCLILWLKLSMLAGFMSDKKLKMAQDSIRNAVWEYTHTIEDVLLLCRTFHAWSGAWLEHRIEHVPDSLLLLHFSFTNLHQLLPALLVYKTRQRTGLQRTGRQSREQTLTHTVSGCRLLQPYSAREQT